MAAPSLPLINITLTQPDAITAPIAVSSNYNGAELSCNGDTDGEINGLPYWWIRHPILMCSMKSQAIPPGMPMVFITGLPSGDLP